MRMCPGRRGCSTDAHRRNEKRGCGRVWRVGCKEGQAAALRAITRKPGTGWPASWRITTSSICTLSNRLLAQLLYVAALVGIAAVVL